MNHAFRQRKTQGPAIPTFLFATLVALVGSACAFGEQPNANRPYAEWVTSYATAVEQSQRTGRPIMLVFSGSDWCSWCNRLADEVFNTHEFARWSTDNVIKVEVDFPSTYQLPADIRQQNEQLKQKYGHHINSFPTVLFVTADGTLIGKTGYVAGGPENWIQKAAVAVNLHNKPDLVAKK